MLKRVYCKNKYEFDVLQTHLVKNYDFLWADGRKYYCPNWFDDSNKGVILELHEIEIETKNYLTVSNCRYSDCQLKFSDFVDEINEIKSKEVKDFTESLFSDIL